MVDVSHIQRVDLETEPDKRLNNRQGEEDQKQGRYKARLAPCISQPVKE